jgi:CBS domain containing-hemolysin-like protein
MTILILAVVFTLTVSFFCSLLEATLLSFSPSQLAGLEAKKPKLGAIWRNFKEHIEKPIAVILITNTASHTVGATVAGAQFEKLYGTGGLILFSVLFTYLMLQFTEILPKSLGVRYSAGLAPAIGPPLHMLIRVMKPIVWFVHTMNKPFQRDGGTDDDTLEEIAALASSARLNRAIDPQQAKMIHAASQLEERSVRQIVTPRMDIVFLRTDQPLAEVLDVIRNCAHTRLPLCEEDVDHVVGMVHVKDILNTLDLVPGHFQIEQLPEEDPNAPEKVEVVPGSALHVFGTGTIDLTSIKREIIYLPEHLSLLQALQRFQESRIHLAVVVDEYGSTVGIVSLEDVIEEMVGDIRDEFDFAAPRLVKKEGKNYRIQAVFPLHDLVQYLPNHGVDPNEADVDTVGGFMSHTLGRLPQVGDTVRLGGYEWTATKADERRVEEVLLKPIPEEEQDK